ncbi:MAG: HD domain-containing protein [Bacteroidetes Order II. Incertae sedis bacterium]|nr:HD domain-containing protein [Bacteroidetes Order II. bacterium]
MSSIESLFTEFPFDDVLRRIGEVAKRERIEVYAVGGVVRDVLLGRMTTDIDFVSVGPGSGIRLAKALVATMGGTIVHVYKNFGTAAIRVGHPATKDQLVLEFVGARKESYNRESRNPVVEEGTLEDDQKRRDFTINALAIDLHPDRYGHLIDPFGGVQDLGEGILRTPLDAVQTFDDDPLRIVRAARFACQLGFQIDKPTLRGMRERSSRMNILSMERIADEMQKIMSADKPSIGFRILYECGALQQFFPELVALQGVETVEGVRHKDNFFHTLKVVDNLVESVSERSASETLWLRWAALMHDIGKPRSKRFTEGIGWSFHGHEDKGARMIPKMFRRLKLPTDSRMDYVQKLVSLHHRPVSLVDETVSDSAVRRLLFDAGEEIEDLMLLVRADITSKNPQRVRKYLAAFDAVETKFKEVEEKDHLRNFQPPVDGAEIMSTLGLKPSRAVGMIKNRIREAILDGDIPNDRDAAFDFMMQIKDAILAEWSKMDSSHTKEY